MIVAEAKRLAQMIINPDPLDTSPLKDFPVNDRLLAKVLLDVCEQYEKLEEKQNDPKELD